VRSAQQRPSAAQSLCGSKGFDPEAQKELDFHGLFATQHGAEPPLLEDLLEPFSQSCVCGLEQSSAAQCAGAVEHSSDHEAAPPVLFWKLGVDGLLVLLGKRAALRSWSWRWYVFFSVG
jgi:hypothetical protein